MKSGLSQLNINLECCYELNKNIWFNRSFQFYIFSAVFVFCKVIVLLFSSLLNTIIASVGWWVCGRWIGGSVGKWSVVGGSVVGGFNKTLWGRYKDWDNRHFFLLYGQLTVF